MDTSHAAETTCSLIEKSCHRLLFSWKTFVVESIFTAGLLKHVSFLLLNLKACIAHSFPFLKNVNNREKSICQYSLTMIIIDVVSIGDGDLNFNQMEF